MNNSVGELLHVHSANFLVIPEFEYKQQEVTHIYTIKYYHCGYGYEYIIQNLTTEVMAAGNIIVICGQSSLENQKWV